MFTYSVNAPIAAVQVLTQGVPNLDFTAAANACLNATSGSCSVTVNFSPQAPGMRLGAIVFLDQSNNVLNTTYLSGVGLGPAVANNSAAPVNLFPGGLQNLAAFTTDAASNLYVADLGTGPASQILKYSPATNLTTTILSFGENVNCFSMSLAVDGAGNLFASCVDLTFYGGVLYEFSPNNPTPNTVQSGLGIISLAVDANSNIYAGNTYGSVNKYAPGAANQIGSFSSGPFPAALAVDGAGDVFVADGYYGTVTEFPISGGSATLVSNLDSPAALAVDAAGDLFIGLADTSSGFGEVLEAPYGSQKQIVISQGYAEAVALDSAGNLFVYNPGGEAVTEYPRGQSPWVGFPIVFIGTMESDPSESIQLQNTGNEPLYATGVGTVPNFSGSLSGCASVAPGGTCTATFSFLPATIGSVSASMPLFSNVPPASDGFQNFSLAGAFIVPPGGAAPPNGNSCYGSYTGEFKGNVNVSTGQVCQFNGGIVDGNITVTGGMLFLTNAVVKGNVQIGGSASGDGSSDESICGTTIQGNLQVQNHQNNLAIGGTAATGCASNVIKGNVQVQNNTAAFSIIGNLIGGNLQVQNNTVSGVVSLNNISGNLQCSQDTNLSGNGNTAKQKQGQCASY